MHYDRLESYIEKVYGYAINHTYSREEADELSQEILFTAVRQLPTLKDASKFEPWLWGVASNVTKSFRRHIGKQRTMYSYDVLETLVYEEQYDEKEDVYDALRTKIAMLSAIYRDIIILYYYNGLSTKQIAEQLQIPEGTVTWRLSEARKKLKKECAEMKESALRPVKMNLNIYGSGNYNGKTIPFPTAYIDDALSQNILYYCYEEPQGIESLAKSCGVPAYYIEERMENLLKREAVIEVSKGKYQTDFIIWSDKYGIYCEENAEKVLMPIMEEMLKALDGIAFRQMMYDNYINVCEDILYSGATEDIDSLANAIQDGYIVKKEDGSFFITTPAFTKEQKAEFESIVEKYLAPLMPVYLEIVNRFIAGYKKLFPKHLHEDADRMCQRMFLDMYAVMIAYAQRTGVIPMPSPNCYCDVLVQFKE